MRITIHNVGHGLCISLLHENGNSMLWDCGHTDEANPSEFLPSLGIYSLSRLFITNYDQDHISDLPNLRKNIDIRTLTKNPTISAEQLEKLKLQSGTLSEAMKSMLEMIRKYVGYIPSPPAFPNVTISNYYNKYSNEYPDTNNISLVTFLSAGSTKFIIPGDVETKGWKGLLSQNGFKNELKSVNVFVASHHGRENGYCAEVFESCRPRVVIFSDSSKQYATQEMTNTYASHATGVPFNRETRYVLTTRNDGHIIWDL